MTDRELRERLRAQRAQIPDGFDARQDALLMRLTAGGAPARGRMGKRTLALVLAAALLLACGVAAAAGYFGFISGQNGFLPKQKADHSKQCAVLYHIFCGVATLSPDFAGKADKTAQAGCL